MSATRRGYVRTFFGVAGAAQRRLRGCRPGAVGRRRLAEPPPWASERVADLEGRRPRRPPPSRRAQRRPRPRAARGPGRRPPTALRRRRAGVRRCSRGPEACRGFRRGARRASDRCAASSRGPRRGRAGPSGCRASSSSGVVRPRGAMLPRLARRIAFVDPAPRSMPRQLELPPRRAPRRRTRSGRRLRNWTSRRWGRRSKSDGFGLDGAPSPHRGSRLRDRDGGARDEAPSRRARRGPTRAHPASSWM